MTQNSSPHPSHFAIAWPTAEMPLVFWGVNSKHPALATALKPINPDVFFAKTWQSLVNSGPRKVKFIGFTGYDAFRAQAKKSQHALIYEVHEYLTWDEGKSVPRTEVSGDPKTCALRLDSRAKERLQRDAEDVRHSKIPGSKIFASTSDETYLGQVRDILEAIRSGHFYQLNLLRRYLLVQKWSWSDVCMRVKAHGGPFSSLLRHGNLSIASMSPERFISIESDGGTPPMIRSWPIKGTIERNLTDPEVDRKQKAELVSSQKDQAELHMIVDLMRNDLTPICKPMSVAVEDPGSVQEFHHLYHLQACVAGQLKENVTLQEIFSAVCPAGSITGAPKLEVIKQIDRLECSPRGYFMGNAFVVYSDGTMDSSVLIRTLTSIDGARTWSYAAGSGIVVKSVPEDELNEIVAKCRPVTD